MFNSLKEAAVKQAVKLKEVIDEAAQQDSPLRKSGQDGEQAEELTYLKLENEALKNRLREAMMPPSEREAELESKLKAKIAEHDKLAEKSRELMIRYRKLQADKSAVSSPEAAKVQSTTSVQELEAKLAETQEQLRQAQAELAARSEINVPAINTPASSDEDPNAKTQTLSERLDKEAEDERQGLDEKLQQFQARIEAITRQLDEEKAANADLRQELEKANADLVSARDKLVELESNNQQLLADVQKLGSTVETSNQKVSASETENESLKNALHRTEAELSAARASENKETEIEKLTEDIRNLTEKLEQSQVEVSDAVRRAEIAERKVEELSTRNDSDLQAELDEVDQKCSNLESKLGEVESEREELKAKLESAKDQSRQPSVTNSGDAAENTAALVEREVDLRVALERSERMARASMADLEELNSLRAVVANHEQTESDLRNQLEQLIAKERNMEAQIQELSKSLEALQSHASAAFDQAENAETQLQMQGLKEENERLMNASKEQLDKIDKLERELKALEQNADVTRNRYETELLKEVELRVELDRAERMLSKAQLQVQGLEAKLQVAGNEQDEELNEKIRHLSQELETALAREANLKAALERVEHNEQLLIERAAIAEKAREDIEQLRKSEEALQSELKRSEAEALAREQALQKKVIEAESRLKALQDEHQNRSHDLDTIRAEAMQGREELMVKLQEKEAALEAADETMKKLAAAFDERSAVEAELKKELEAERLRVEETELKMRAEFDKIKLEVQTIFEEKAKTLQQKLEEAQQEAEAAQIACTGFQRQLNQAHEEALTKGRELDSLRERTRDALLQLNEEKKDLQEKLAAANAALERKPMEPAPSPPALLPVNTPDPEVISELERLQNEKSELTEALELSRQLASTLEHDIKHLRVELEATQGILKSTEADEQRFSSENSRLKEELSLLKQEMRTRKERAEKLMTEREAQIDRLTERLNKMQNSEQLHASLEQEEILREENAELRRHLEAKKDEVERTQQEIEVVRKKLADHLQAPGSPGLITPSRHPDNPAAIYLKNVLLSYMSSRDPKEQLGMVKAISQLAGFSAAETENIKRVLEDADKGVLGKFVGSVLSFSASADTPAPPASPTPVAASSSRVMKRIG